MTHHRELEPSPKVIPRGPLSIGVSLLATALKLAKLEKKRKLKNRELMKIPFII